MERTIVSLNLVANGTEAGSEAVREIAFELHHNEIDLGGRRLVHYWIAKPGLYGDRGRYSPNRRAVLDYYWAKCVQEGSARDDPEVLQSYVLAHLTATSRSHGSRRVFLDACLRGGVRSDRLKKDPRQDLLNESLRDARSDRISLPDFYERTRAVLGRPEYSEEAREAYRDLQQRLFPWQSDDRNPDADAAVSIASEVWERDLRLIGRRRGKELQKLVLDMFGYEARAALHRAYSSSWHAIAAALRSCGDLDGFGASFHVFWHLDLIVETDSRSLHLFHGTPFALHPASGHFLSTPTGASLTRELLEQDCAQNQERFLNGMLIAVFDYASRHAEATASRRRL